MRKAREGTGEVYADFVPFKESCFTMKFLSKKQSETMKQAYEKKLFDRYWHIVSVLDRASERLWLSLWNKMQKPQFLRGDEAYILSYGFRYDQDKKDLVSISEAEIGKILRNVYST